MGMISGMWCDVMPWYRVCDVMSCHDIGYVMMSCPCYWHYGMSGRHITSSCNDSLKSKDSPEVDERYSEGAPVPLYSPTAWWYRIYSHDIGSNMMSCHDIDSDNMMSCHDNILSCVSCYDNGISLGNKILMSYSWWLYSHLGYAAENE